LWKNALYKSVQENKAMIQKKELPKEAATSLLSGEKVWKDDLRVEAFGTIDELSSQLGLAKNFTSKETKAILEILQEDLFKAGAELAARKNPPEKSLQKKDLEFIEQHIEEISGKMRLSGFVVPGKNKGSAHLDICRTVARRAERRIVSLARAEAVSELVLIYFNRLSFLLFLLARSEEKSCD